MVKILFKKIGYKNICFIFLIILVISVFLNFILISKIYEKEKILLKSSEINKISEIKSNYSLLDTNVAVMDFERFLKEQKRLTQNYIPLKKEVQEYINKKKQGEVYFYYEDLKTGAWIGINEKIKSYPGSIIKVPVLVAVLKEIEEGDYNLNTNVTVLYEDLDPSYGALIESGYNYQLSILELIRQSIQKSDNTSYRTLRRILKEGSFETALFNMGLEYGTWVVNNILPMNAKEIGTMFKTLYYSSYLKRSSSQMALSLLSNTEFRIGLRSGIPEGINVAHKFGSWQDETGKYYNDCGIVYPKNNKDYILCVMVLNYSLYESQFIIEDISEIVYESIEGIK